MGSIRRPYYSVSGGTDDIDFIQCVDGREPQLHEMWCLGLDNVTRKIHLTAQVDIGAGTMGEFTTNCLAENGRIIPIIGKLSINGSVQFLGIPYFVINCGLSFIENLQASNVPTGWGHANTTNHNWGVIPGGSYSMRSVPWGCTIPAHPSYMPRSL